MHGLVDKSEVILVIPIGNHNWPNIDIILSCLRTMDDDRSDSAARVLSAVMAVIPGSSKQIGTEKIAQGTARDNRTLSDRWYTIIPWGSWLPKAMPMQSGALIRKIIGYVDLDPISPICLNQRTREAAIDGNAVLLDTIR